MVCDQISQCPEAEDEANCEEFFPSSATWSCTKPNTANNITIPIKATPCNAIVECDDGSDEMDCPSTTRYTLITLSMCFVICGLVSVFVIHFTDVHEEKSFPMLDLEEMEKYQLRDVIILCQNSSLRKSACHVFYNRLLKEHQGYLSKVLNEAKVTT